MTVERHVEIRRRAMEFTRDNPLDGNGVKTSTTSAMSDLLSSCREYDTNLRAVMGVIWSRLHRSKNSRHLLMTLELLTRLISEGPLTVITEALDGLPIIGKMKSFSDGKNGAANNSEEVRGAASRLYGLLVDLPILFAARRHIVVAKAEVIPMQQSSWSNYLVSRLPMRIDGHTLHALFRPRGMHVQRRIWYDDDNSLDAVIADNSDDDASSFAALRRAREGGEKGFELYHKQVEINLDWMDIHFNELLRKSESSSRSGEQQIRVAQDVGGGMTAGDLFPD